MSDDWLNMMPPAGLDPEAETSEDTAEEREPVRLRK